MPNELIWRGDMQKQAQVEHWTPDEVEAGDSFTLTCNRKDITVTASETLTGEAALIADVVGKFVTAIGDYDNDIPEWKKISASAGTTNGVTTHLVLTGPTDGEPFTVTSSTSDAGNLGVSVTTITAGTAGQNEKQKIQHAGTPTSGTFTITFDGQTTGNIAYDASAATVQTALEALSNIASGDVTVTGDAGGPWTVEFKQAHANTNVPVMTTDGSNLAGAAAVAIATATEGAAQTNEVQRIDIKYTDSSSYHVVTLDSALANKPEATIGNDWAASTIESIMNAAIADALGGYTVAVSDTTTASGFDRSYLVEYTGAAAGADADPATVSGPSTLTDSAVTTITEGSSTSIDEVQTVELQNNPTGGTFTLTFSGQTTSSIAYNASAATVETALEALSTITDVTVTGSDGGPWSVTFNDPGGQDVSEMTGDASSLTGSTVGVTTTQSAVAAANEKQQVRLTGAPGGGTFTLTWDPGGGDETTGNIAYDASAATVQTALEGLATPGSGDFNVTGDAGGPWVVEFKGTYASTDVNEMTGDATNLTTGLGTQTLTKSTQTSPEGPNWFSKAENWQTVGSSTANAPAAGDTLYFRDSDVDCLWGLDANSGDTFAAVYQEASFTGNLGLDTWNEEGFWEYRTTALTAGITTLVIGEGTGTGSARSRYNLEAVQSTVTVLQTGSSLDDLPACIIKGSHASNVLRVLRGSVGVALEKSGDTATFTTIEMAYVDDEDSDAQVVIGSGVSLTTFNQRGGESDVRCAGTTFTQTGGESRLSSGAWTTVEILGGSCLDTSDGTWTTVVIGPGATIDATGTTKSQTWTDTTLHAGATLIDDHGRLVFTNEYQLDNCGYEDVTLRVGKNISATRTNL